MNITSTARLSLFSSYSETKAERFITLAELAAKAERPTTGPKGKAALIVPFESDKKTGEAAQAAPFAAVVIDHDNDNLTADAIRALYGPDGLNVRYLAFTTTSHMQPKGNEPALARWKVIVPFADAQDAATAGKLAVGIAYSLKSDPAQARAQQGFYAPNKQFDGAEYDHINALGEPRQWLRADDGESVFIQQALAGWRDYEASTAKIKPRPPATLSDGNDSVIGKITQEYGLHELLQQCGYKHTGKNSYLSPQSSTGIAGVRLLERDGRQVVYSHHGPADPLSSSNHDGHALDVADVLCALSYGGDFARMIRGEAARLDPDGNKQRQREFMQERERQRKADAPNAPTAADDASAEAPATPADHPLTRFVDLSAPMTPPDWILPGFNAEGLTVFAGAHGVGKTTTLLPLAATAAGVHLERCEFAPEHWRHVVYITEDVPQARRIVGGLADHLAEHGVSDAHSKIAARLHVVEASRMCAEKIVQTRHCYRDQFSHTVTTTGEDGERRTVTLLPLVVIDTAAATIAMENESDNSEASDTIATLKQRFGGLPVWLVGHTAKANMGPNRTVTARGASAFEADANQVIYLVNDEHKDRFLTLGKTRFEPRWPELKINSFGKEVHTLDRFGAGESFTVRWSIVVPLTPAEAMRKREQKEDQKKADKAKAKADAAKRASDELKASILQTINDDFDKGKRFNRTALRDAVTASTTACSAAIESLLTDGLLHEVQIPSKERQHPKKADFLIALDEAERETFKATGTLPEHKLIIPPDWKKAPKTAQADAE